MRRILPFLVFLAVAGCALPETRWVKDGADDKLAAGDLTYCRQAARNEAFQAYPFGYASPFYGFHRWAAWDDDRFYTENRLADFCMRSKGYQLVTVNPPRPTPPSAPPAEAPIATK